MADELSGPRRKLVFRRSRVYRDGGTGDGRRRQSIKDRSEREERHFSNTATVLGQRPELAVQSGRCTSNRRDGDRRGHAQIARAPVNENLLHARGKTMRAPRRLSAGQDARLESIAPVSCFVASVPVPGAQAPR